MLVNALWFVLPKGRAGGRGNRRRPRCKVFSHARLFSASHPRVSSSVPSGLAISSCIAPSAELRLGPCIFIRRHYSKGNTTAFHRTRKLRLLNNCQARDRRKGKLASCGRRGGFFLQHLFFAVPQGSDVLRSQFKTMSVGDRVGGARLHAIAAENAA